MENVFFSLAFTAYVIGMGLYFVYLGKQNLTFPRVAKGILWAAVFCHTASLVIRTIHARQMPQYVWYVPWSNWFESFSLFALVITVVFLCIQAVKPLPILGAFITPLVTGGLIMAIQSPAGRQIPLLPPALQSYWMALHVPVMFIAYAAFANAFGLGLAYLIQEHQLKSKNPSRISFQLPPLDELDNLIYRVIGVAFPMLTLGILLGAVWANEAWGRTWGWDPKETWSFITWMVYLVYLHTRLIVGWRGRKTAYLSLAGFGAVIFTYIGVNYLSPLHGFLSGGGR
ncbi:MAG: c-type cytochrome biogenesis protein CcsB [Elusimicrobia bacterium]|nr:c-type cytochrome biogenesis protein CcsB [Candidatus Obscuribacterium magneticum]